MNHKWSLINTDLPLEVLATPAGGANHADRNRNQAGLCACDSSGRIIEYKRPFYELCCAPSRPQGPRLAGPHRRDYWSAIVGRTALVLPTTCRR
jgi:hypothetical protein